MLATRALGAGKADVSLKADSHLPPTPTPGKAGSKSFYRQMEGTTCRNGIVILTDILKLVIGGLVMSS